MAFTEKQVLSMMKFLGCSREEAIAELKEDEKIDKMSDKEVNADLTKEQKKAIKEAKNVGTKKTTAYKFDTKSKKIDNEKADFITKVCDFVKTFEPSAKIENVDREITFTIGENAYSLVLTKHRPKKG